MQAANRVQNWLQPPSQLVIVAIIKTLKVNLVEIHPGSQVLQHLGSAVSVGNEGGQQSGGTGFLEDRYRPFAGNQRLIVGTHQDLRALLKSLLHQLLGGGGEWRHNRFRVTQGLRRHPVLTIPTVRIAAQHSKAVRQGAGVGVEEWLLFDRVALHSAGVAPRNVQGPASVVANLADTRLALWDRAAVTTGKTAHAVAVKSLVKFALAAIFVNDIPQRRHTTQLCPATSDDILLNGAPVRRTRECIFACPLAPHAQAHVYLRSAQFPPPELRSLVTDTLTTAQDFSPCPILGFN